MNSVPPVIATDDVECLRAWARRASVERLWPIIERYFAFVYSSALRRTGDAVQADEVTRAVFFVLARRARKLRKKTVLADWLFRITAITCRKIKPNVTRRWFGFRRRTEFPPETNLWTCVAAEIDHALDRLPSAQRKAVLLRTFLNYDGPSAARILRTAEHRVTKRLERGLKKIAKRLGKRGVLIDPKALAVMCAEESSTTCVPEGLPCEVLELIGQSLEKRPLSKLARRVLSTLAWTRWRRRIAIGIPTFIALLAITLGTAWYIDSLSGHSRLMTEFFFWSVRHEARTVPGLAQPARPYPTKASVPRLSATAIRQGADLYQTTNIWLAHLKFSREQWEALEPKRIAPLPHFLQPDGTVLLRHPQAQRSGLAGVLGLNFNWAHADFEFGGTSFTNVAARFKGNGTYVTSLYGSKHPFKVDLNRFTKSQKLGGCEELNFHNLVDDRSFMSDALAYEFFRDAGVPAPRTAYAYLNVSVERQWDRKPLGLYVMVEPVDQVFAAERLSSKKAPIFKPVTYQLFEFLGDDWSAYAAIYDLKTKATPAQERRVIEFARLVSRADEKEFARRVGEFLDLDEFARFLACEVLLSCYDSFLADGQNYYVYLDPRSNRFGFIPWDLDLAWGGFFLLGSTRERERASIWHPWVGRNRFLQRVMAVEEFRQIYRSHLEDLSSRLFVPDRLKRRVDEIAHVIREPIAAESDFRLDKFDQAVGNKVAARTGPDRGAANRPVHQIKRFIDNRAISVRQQLDGKSDGVILQRRERK